MSNAGVLSKTLRIVRRTQELIRPPHVVPLRPCEFDIAALRHVVIHRNDEERRCIRGGIGVRIILEPWNKACSLGNLVRNLSILTLIFTDEVDSGASG